MTSTIARTVGHGSQSTFGDRLRHLRLDAGLTQEALAERTGVSAQAIGALERGDRRYPHSQTVAMIAAGLGVEIGALDPPRRAGAPRRAPEPDRALAAAATGLIGRERELAAAADLLATSEGLLVTITGPPGVGKTRLALALGAGAGRRRWGDVVAVSLASLADHQLVAPTIARRLGLRDEKGPALEALAAGIGARRLLLVLDNFEHVLPAAPLIAGLVTRCPGLRVLATSRGSLRVSGELELCLAPLPLGDAVTLFVQRARERCPGFELTAGNRDAVTDIGRRLDGLPLAIELAAPWVRLMSPGELLARLSTRLDLLVSRAGDLPERQRTMRGALEWSHALLSPEEQAVFRRASVFAGGATTAALESVCGSGCAQPLQAVAGLVDHGLLLPRETDGEPRLMALGTVREYGQELLRASGEHDEVGRAHAAHFAAVVDEARPLLMGADQGRWFARLERELDNLRAALRWAGDHGAAELGLRMAVSLYRFWDTHGHMREGRAWLERWLGEEASVPLDLRAQGLRASGELAARLADYEASTERAEASLALYRELDDQPGIARALCVLAGAAWAQSRFERAAELSQEGLDRWRVLGDRWQIAYALSGLALSVAPLGDRSRALALHQEALTIWRALGEREAPATALLNIAILLRQEGLLERSQSLLEEARRICREVGNIVREASVLHAMGSVARAAGDRDTAARRYREALRIRLGLGARIGIAQSLEGAAATTADPALAARLFGCADAIRDALGAPRHPEEEPEYGQGLADLRRVLGEDSFRREALAGRALSLEQACAAALGEVLQAS
jgi:predicted ATPase/DNA-binding XRE family transcriptional regulator